MAAATARTREASPAATLKYVEGYDKDTTAENGTDGKKPGGAVAAAAAKPRKGFASSGLLPLVVLGALLGGVYMLGGGSGGMKKGVEAAIRYVETQGDNGMYVYLGLTVLCIILPFGVPITPLELAGGVLFSAKYGMMTTWILTSVAKFAANFVSIIIARYMIRDWVMTNIISKFELLRLVSGAVKEEPYKMAFLVRGSMIPLSVKNYGLGVMEIGYLPICFGSAIFTPLYGFRNISMGSGFKDIAEVFAPRKAADGPMSWQDSAQKVLPIVLNILLICITAKAIMNQIKKKKNVIEQELREKQGKEGAERKKDQ